MKIIRYAKNKKKWLDNEHYRESFYNIIQSNGQYSAIYNSASGAIVILDSNNMRYDKLNLEEENFRILVENGFFVPQKIDEYTDYYQYIQFADKSNINYFTIIPTTVCNARCFYCYESDYHKQTLNRNICNKIIEYIWKNIKDKQDFVFDWYGGEPLLCVDSIDYIISRLLEREDCAKKEWTSSITTNGILFTENLINHAVEKWHLEIAHITIDGTEEEHNRRKKVNLGGRSAFQQTYQAIIELLKAGVYVNLRIHLDNDNRNSFAQIINDISAFFEFQNFHVFPTFLFPPTPEIVGNYNYIVDSEKEDFFYNIFKELFKSNLINVIPDSFPLPRTLGCFAEKSNTIVIAPDGSLHTCVQGFFEEDKFQKKINVLFRNACEKCRECSFFPICLGGCLYNRTLENKHRTPCVRNRFIIKPLLKILLEINKTT